MQYCSLQHWTLLSSLDKSTTGHRFLFGSTSPFLLGLFVCSSPVAYWTPVSLGGFIFQCHVFLTFRTFHGVLKARTLKWFAFAFSMDYHGVLSEPSTMTHPSWVALHSMAHNFIEAKLC